MDLSISASQTRFLHLKSQRLVHNKTKAGTSPVRLLKEIMGVQAQDLPAALLSIRARSSGLTRKAVEKAREEDRSIALTWLMRGTLHLAASEDVAWLIPLLGPDFIKANQRRFMQLGWDEESAARAIQIIRKILGAKGSLTRSEIILCLKENGFPYEGQAPVHLLYRAALEGILCVGPNQGDKQAYVLFDDWLGTQKPMPRRDALENLAVRFLEAYGPAGVGDFASWSGLKISEAREAWRRIGSQVVAVDLAGQAAWMLKSRFHWLDEPLNQEPEVSLLPRFDTYLLGYASRDLVVDPAYANRINAGGGMISAALLVNGQVRGIWKTRRVHGSTEIAVEPFESLSEDLIPYLQNEVADLGRFLEEETVLSIKNP